MSSRAERVRTDRHGHMAFHPWILSSQPQDCLPLCIAVHFYESFTGTLSQTDRQGQLCTGAASFSSWARVPWVCSLPEMGSDLHGGTCERGSCSKILPHIHLIFLCTIKQIGWLIYHERMFPCALEGTQRQIRFMGENGGPFISC